MTQKSPITYPINCCALVMMVLVSMHALPLSGATFLVGDETELAAAIVESNTNSASDIIELTGSIVLTSPLPVINEDVVLSILGGGFTLSRDSESETEFGILRIENASVEIENLTISGGVAVEGGGVSVNGGELTMVGCTVTGNFSGEDGGGGGIMVREGDLTLTRCLISGNSAASGGGLAAFASSESEVPATFTVTLIDCTITGNIVYEVEEEDFLLGGGIVIGGEVEMLVNGCTISDNSAPFGGGVVAFFSANMTLTNTTVTGNTATRGGGVFNYLGTTALVHCTVTGNSATEIGGGILNIFGELTLLASVIAGNEANQGSEISNSLEVSEIVADVSNVLGHSGVTLAEAFMNFTPDSSDLVCTSDGNTPTALGSILNPTLADNGGSTLTHALVAGSPAIDLVSAGSDTDQRGISRPQGLAYDAGAFELEGGAAPEPDTDPSGLYEEYWHTVTSNTITARNWNLDPNSILGDSPAHSFASGLLPRGLSLLGPSLSGRFVDLGSYSFTIVSRSGIHEVRNHFQVRVIPPAVAPLIAGIWVNDQYHSMNIMEARAHGVAAVTELFSVNANVGEPLTMVFDWDYTRDDSSFKIIRGDLPTGLALKKHHVNGFPSAAITGSPTEAGEFIFVVSVLDWRGRGYQWIRLVVE